MRITIQRSALRRVIDATKGAADQKAALKMLAHVLLVAEDGALYATATDLYRVAETGAACDVATPGSVCLHASDLLTRIVKLPDGPVEIESIDGDSKVTLRASGKALRYSMPATPGDAFPKLPFSDENRSGPTLTIPASTLDAMIGSVLASVSTDTTRPHVNAALFEWAERNLRMVSTDGHRMSLRDAANAETTAGHFLIPLIALTEVRRIVADAGDGETVTLSYTAPWAHMSIGAGSEALEFSFATPEADFPPYAQILGVRGHVVPCRVNRTALEGAVSGVAVASGNKTGAVKLVFSQSSVSVMAESAEGGTGFDEVPATYGGPEMTAGYCARYLLDALGPIDTDDVELGVGTPLEPLCVSAAGSSAYLAVVMPMRL